LLSKWVCVGDAKRVWLARGRKSLKLNGRLRGSMAQRAVAKGRGGGRGVCYAEGRDRFLGCLTVYALDGSCANPET